jgi:hypothetical protein
MPSPDTAAHPSSLLTSGEIASCAALVREVGLGNMMATVPVWRAEAANRILESVCAQLRDQGFLVVVVDGGSDEVVRKAWLLIAQARIAASRMGALSSTVLIVKDAQLLAPGQLELLAQAGDVAVVTAPVVPRAVRRGERWLSRLRMASTWVAPALAALTAGTLLWLAVERYALDMGITQHSAGRGPGAGAWQGRTESAKPVAPTETAATAIAPSNLPVPPAAGGAPGLLLVAKPGDTLESLYQRIYRGVTPPPFSTIAALNPEPVRPGAIPTFPEPVNGWAMGQ